MSDVQVEAIADILHTYTSVASGRTKGSGGVFAADGKGTLNAVTIPIEKLEALAKAFGSKVYGRTAQDRE